MLFQERICFLDCSREEFNLHIRFLCIAITSDEVPLQNLEDLV